MTELLSELIEAEPKTFEQALMVWRQIATRRAEVCVKMEKVALQAEQEARSRYGPEDTESIRFAGCRAAFPFRADWEMLKIHEAVAYHRMTHLKELESTPYYKMPEVPDGK